MSFTKEDTKVMKGLAIFLMLYHHLFTFADRINYEYITAFNYQGQTISSLIGEFGQICVAIFLYLGGYGIYKLYNSDNVKFLKTKLLTLYKAFWKVLFIVVPISLLLNVDRVVFEAKPLFENFIGMHLTYNGEWWFLTIYILLILISPLLIKIIDSKKFNIINSFIILFLLNGFITYIYPDIMNLDIFNTYRGTIMHNNIMVMFKYLPVFVCGMLSAKYNILDEAKKKLTGNYLLDISAVLLIVFIFLLRRQIGTMYDFIITPAFITCWIIIISMPIFKYPKKILLEVGKQSTNIWLIHSFFCYLWCQEFIFMPKYAILIFLLLLVVSYLSGILIDVVYKLLSKLVDKISKRNFKHKVIN